MQTWKRHADRVLCVAVCLHAGLAMAEVRVPAFTAYLDPYEGGPRVSQRDGITGWNDPGFKVLWFGELKTTGRLDARVLLRLGEGARSRLRLTVAGQSRDADVAGSNVEPVTAGFGAFDIASPGVQRFVLESLNGPGQPCGDLEALILTGPPLAEAHFNLKPRRNAASVHLRYLVPADAQVEAFTCEVTGLEDPLWTYYMACGWHRGYFGMQVNSATERRIIFSVWDSGTEAVDRSRVAEEDRVTLVAKGDGVVAGDFGNEGTGGHSHLKYAWRTGERQRFVVTARPVDATHTVFSGFYFHPDKRHWVLISSWRAPDEGGHLRGLYSFSENFSGANGHLVRKALYGNPWVRTPDGRWVELTAATFSHDPTGKADRLDRFMGLENGKFFLSHGGFIPGTTRYGERFDRPALGRPPTDILLPDIPE